LREDIPPGSRWPERVLGKRLPATERFSSAPGTGNCGVPALLALSGGRSRPAKSQGLRRLSQPVSLSIPGLERLALPCGNCAARLTGYKLAPTARCHVLLTPALTPSTRWAPGLGNGLAGSGSRGCGRWAPCHARRARGASRAWAPSAERVNQAKW